MKSPSLCARFVRSGCRRPRAGRLFFAWTAGLLASPLLAAPAANRPADAPANGAPVNIVLILADDLGYADTGYQGCRDVPTPHIDSIARQGVIFTEGYANGFVCSPTRAALLTGRYQNRFGCEYHIGPFRRAPDAPLGLPLNEKTIAERLQPLGYATALIGKWHLGGEIQENQALMPPRRGFDEFFGILEGASLYDDVHNRERKYRRGLHRVDREEAYYTDALGREAVSFIRRHREQPFLLYLPFTAVHAPRQAKAEHLEKFNAIPDETRRTLAGMLFSMDENIGRVLAALEETGLEDRTLVIFFSDNGGKPNDNGSRNVPLRGQKGQFYEGGIHVPFCMKWPGRIEPGQVFPHPIMSMDLFPTILRAAGGTIDPAWNLDGVDLMPYLSGARPGRPHQDLFWRSGEKFAVRHGDWKLVKDQGAPELFNLAEDPCETRDLATERPDHARRLMKQFQAWSADMVPPNYGWNARIGPRAVKQEVGGTTP